jgi:hypothetical protein
MNVRWLAGLLTATVMVAPACGTSGNYYESSSGVYDGRITVLDHQDMVDRIGWYSGEIQTGYWGTGALELRNWTEWMIQHRQSDEVQVSVPERLGVIVLAHVMAYSSADHVMAYVDSRPGIVSACDIQAGGTVSLVAAMERQPDGSGRVLLRYAAPPGSRTIEFTPEMGANPCQTGVIFQLTLEKR